jgi:hypothetical protein
VTSRVDLIDEGFIRRTRELRLKKSKEVDMLIPIGVALRLFLERGGQRSWVSEFPAMPVFQPTLPPRRTGRLDPPGRSEAATSPKGVNSDHLGADFYRFVAFSTSATKLSIILSGVLRP